MKKYSPKEIIPITTPIHTIRCPKAWNQLANREKMYAYYMSKAAW